MVLSAELHPLVRWQFQGGLDEDQRRAFLFTHVVGADGRRFDMPVVVGALSASARIYALGLGCAVEDIGKAWTDAIAHPLPPVAATSAPCQEVAPSKNWAGPSRSPARSTGKCNPSMRKEMGLDSEGPGGSLGIAEYVYDAEVSMLFDYRADRTWSAVKIKYDNDAGTISGRTDAIKLDRAYLGARLRDADTFTVDLEIGRRSLGNIFDSKVEFSSLFDGILLKYDLASQKAGDFYVHAGVFLVNERRSQYAYVGEFGMMRIANSNFYTKYSIIDWDTKDDTHLDNTFAKIAKNNFEFVISQMIFGYRWTPVKFKKTVEFYLAGSITMLPIS